MKNDESIGRLQQEAKRIIKEKTDKNTSRGLLWWIMFILCLVYAVLFSLFIFIGFSMFPLSDFEYHLVYGIVPVLATFVSILIALKWELVSGIMLIAEYIFLLIWDVIDVYAFSLIIYSHFLVMGILFIISWFLHRRSEQKHLQVETG